MSAETKKVLEMLAAGKISAEDAERLLDKLKGAAPGEQSKAHADSGSAAGASAASGGAQAPRPRFIRIQIDRPGREDVNVRVPLSSVRGGRHWTAFLPLRVAEKLSEYGLDFGEFDRMSDENFQAALDRINVDIQKGNGKRVRIYAE